LWTRLSPGIILKAGFIVTTFYGTKQTKVRNGVRKIPVVVEAFGGTSSEKR
jgi:hypothetical protein